MTDRDQLNPKPANEKRGDPEPAKTSKVAFDINGPARNPSDASSESNSNSDDTDTG